MSTDDGLEVLVHIGINTVSLNGTGFQTKHKVGDQFCMANCWQQ
ncbi:MAG: PTS glucose transporter subunit IIA [Ruminococcus callidus]